MPQREVSSAVGAERSQREMKIAARLALAPLAPLFLGRGDLDDAAPRPAEPAAPVAAPAGGG